MCFLYSYLNRWTQPDTIITLGPQGLNRYSYTNNNPVKNTDPTGHCLVGNVWVPDTTGGCPGNGGVDGNGYVDDSGNTSGSGSGGGDTPPNPDGPGGDYSNNQTNNINLPFDTYYLANLIPGTPEQWKTAGDLLDEAALGADAIAGLFVLGVTAIGTGGGFTFGGDPVTGLAGAAAGYVAGETMVGLSGYLNVGNTLATASTLIGTFADTKSGTDRIRGDLQISPGNIHLVGEGQISTGTITSGALTSWGWGTPITTLSLLLQTASVANDRGVFPTWSVPFNFNFSFP